MTTIWILQRDGAGPLRAYRTEQEARADAKLLTDAYAYGEVVEVPFVSVQPAEPPKADA